MKDPKCPYCDNKAELVTGDVIYPHRPDLFKKHFWRCAPCNAYVGCHPGTVSPLGRIANVELRRAKSDAHAAFDPLWKSWHMKRKDAYKFLADQLGIKVKRCHIGHFDLDMCKRVIEVCG